MAIQKKEKLSKEERAHQNAIAYVKKLHDSHKGAWLTAEVAEAYWKKGAEIIATTESNSYTGLLRQLGDELIKEYGVSQIEAINILNGYHINQYVDKYYKIAKLMPLSSERKSEVSRLLDELQNLTESMNTRDDGFSFEEEN